MGAQAIKASAVVGVLLRSKRKEVHLTLRDVSRRLERDGERIPTSTLARIEQGKLDPGIRRLHRLLRLYNVPPHLVADLIELEELAVEPPKGKDLETLYSEGVRHWREGNVKEGLACLFAVRQHVPGDEPSRLLRQKATLAFAVAARNLGKLKLARELVHELLCEPPDRSLLVDALVLSSSLWRGLGSRDVALALVREAEEHLEPEQADKRAWVLHQKAKLLAEADRTVEAERSLREALELYRSRGDTYGEARALILHVELLEARGKIQQALKYARSVLKMAQTGGHARLVVVASLELGRLLVASGSTDEGLQVLREGLGKAAVLGDRNAEFQARHRLWKAYEASGDRENSQLEREAAKCLVRFIDDSSSEADEVRRLLAN